MAGNFHVDGDLRDHIVRHLVSVIEATPAQDDPFPHFTLAGFFPDDVYARLLELLPPVEHYQPFMYEKHADDTGASNRRRCQLDNANIDALPARHIGFWYTVRSALGSPELKRAVFHKLREGLAYRYQCTPEQAVQQPGYALPELYRELGGYSIKPHPDASKKVVTMQISLAADASQEHLGTEFYTRNLWPTAWLREPRGFDVAKTASFLPNAAYAFVVLNTAERKSWHGRTPIDTGAGARNSILNIWYAKAEDGNMDLISEQQSFATRRQAA